MVNDTRRVAARVMSVFSIITMLAVALFKTFWLLMGILALDGGPMPKIYVINLVEAPTYLVSALAAWKWPWFAEFVAGMTLVAILTKIIPPPIFPYQRYLSWEFAFIVAANVAFFAAVLLRHDRIRDA